LHSITFTNVTYYRLHFLTMRSRLFAFGGTDEQGMPYYEIVVGAPGRRIIKKTGESERETIAISMKTSEIFLARTIAAHLTLESDRMLRDGRWRMLSTQEVKTILSNVARASPKARSRGVA
jgi:hypothetical protein